MLDLKDDDWEYRRLLELIEMLDPQRIGWLIQYGLTSKNSEIAEAANEFRNSL